MPPVLYSNPSSYYSMIARLVLAEKDTSYQLNNVDIHIKMEQFLPEYVKIQPNMSVPTLVNGDDIINDSHQILFYVNTNCNPEYDLFPKQDQEAITKSLDLHYGFSIEDLTMGTALTKSPIAKIALGRGLKRGSNRCIKLMAEYPELRDACEKKLHQEDERRRLILSRDNNYTLVKQQAINLCDYLEKELTAHEYAATNQYSLADVVWTIFLGRLTMIKFDHLINERPNLRQYFEKVQKRKSYLAADLCTKMPPKMIIKIMFALLFRS